MTATSRRWLAGASLLVAAYAVALVVAGPVAARAFDVLGFGLDAGGVPEGPARSYVLFVYGVLGAVLTGWMLTVAAVAAGPRSRPGAGVGRVVGVPLAVWFLLDTGFSLVTGWWQHAVFNLAFLALIGGPLVAGPGRELVRGPRTRGATIGGTSDDPAITGELPEEQDPPSGPQ